MDQPSDQEPYSLSANPLQGDQFNTDYPKTFNPLSQATNLTASLSQLPSVASSVFSSFSSILRGNSPTPNTSNDQQQIDSYNALPTQTLGDVPLISGGLSYQSEETAVPAVVPTFYSTNDAAFLPPAPALSPPPSNLSSGNAYRLTTKRKTYAPAPGLSHQDNQAVPSSYPSHALPLPHTANEPNFPVNPSATYQSTAVNQTTYQNTAVNQSPSQNNKFSLTSFFKTPLLEKITGSSGSYNQESTAAAVPNFFVPLSTNQPTSVTAINPGLFDTHPVSENIQTFPAEQQTFQPTPQPQLTTPLFFNSAQQTNLNTTNQTQPSFYGTIESVPNTSSIPSSTIPPSGNVSNYRLRGKPHYKNPLSSNTNTTTPLVIPFPQATSSSVPPVGIFNPVNINLPSDSQEQSISSTVYTSQSIDPSCSSHQSAPNVSFFNQPQSVPAESNALFNQFNLTNSGNATAANDFATSTFDPFGRGNFPQPSIQSQSQLTHTHSTQLQTQQQQSQLHPVQPQPCQEKQSELHSVQPQLFQLQPCQDQSSQFYPGQLQVDEIQPGPLSSDNITPVEDTDHVKQSASINYPILASDQAQLLPVPDINQQTAQLQSGPYQRSEPVKEADQFQQLFQQQPTQSESELPGGNKFKGAPVQQPSFANPFTVPTSHPGIEEQQNFVQPIYTSDIFTQFQPPPSQEESKSNTLPEAILQSTQAQISNLNLNQEKSSGEIASFFDSGESQRDDTNVVKLNETDTASADCKNSSTFDQLFNRQTSQQSENSNYPEPPLPEPQLPEPVASSTLASTFFSTPSNSSDWFNSSKTVDPSTNQFDVNKNTQAPSGLGTVDASSFFATNSNQPPNYFQIQNFFNNPPLIADTKEQDNSFNFIENKLINKRLHNLTHKASTETDGGSISSNIVEPPSSAQSEFSEFAEVNPETAQSDEYLGEQQV